MAAPMTRVAFAATVGTTIEWYDFFIYGTAAALVFNKLFFPQVDPLIGTLLAFGTSATGFLARPLGAIVAGHYGDRVGRKALLMITLVFMGGATCLIGLLPTYSSIGIFAPILLLVLRVIQGFATGGEWGGAALMTVEHAGEKRRGLWGSLITVGIVLGLVIASLVFNLFTQLPDAAFMSWGWRVPFLLSAVLVVIGLYMRLNIAEIARVQENGGTWRTRKTADDRRFAGMAQHSDDLPHSHCGEFQLLHFRSLQPDLCVRRARFAKDDRPQCRHRRRSR